MKKFSIVLAFAALVCTSQADWLLWTVTDLDAIDFDEATQAQIGYVLTGTVPEWGAGTRFLSYATDDTAKEFGVQKVNLSSGEEQATMVDLSDMTIAAGKTIADYSFFVELVNSSGEVIARTEKDGAKYVTYASLKDVNVAADIGGVPDAVVWHGGTLEAVPEPSSMALLALGAGLVGLRRKLRKNKKDKKEKRA